MKKKVLWITETALMIAVLIVLQFVTRSLGQFVTGSCVNMVLGIAALVGGAWCGVTVALLSPIFAYMLGVAAMPVVLVPGVALGNIVFAAELFLIAGNELAGGGAALARRYNGLLVSAAAKFVVLWLVVVKVLVPLAGLPEQKVAALTATFTWPQLVTALIGGVVAVTAAPLIRKALKRS